MYKQSYLLQESLFPYLFSPAGMMLSGNACFLLEADGVMSEWKAFSALAVEWLGMPVEAMPFYSSSALIRWKVRRILGFVMETGNFGHNRDMSYYNRYPYLIRKAISLWRHTWDFLRQLMIFPLDAMRAWGAMIVEGVGAVRRGR